MRRKKKEKFRNTIPNNYSFWSLTLSREDEINDFLKRGNKRQFEEIKHTLIYIQRFEPEQFEEIKGKEILRRLK